MRKRIFGRRLKRDINQRKLLFRSLMRELVVHGRIKTTEAKAKAVKGEMEKLVTKAKVGGEASRVHLQKYFTQDIVTKLITDVAPVFKDRPGGYTRIMRLGNRVKDNAPMVIMEWVDAVVSSEPVEPKKRNAKKTTKSKTTQSKKTDTKEASVKTSKEDKKETKDKKESSNKASKDKKTQSKKAK